MGTRTQILVRGTVQGVGFRPYVYSLAMRRSQDLLDGRSAGEVSARFHLSVAHLIATVARTIRDGRKLNQIALSGGVFQNMLLLGQAYRLLESDGFEVLIHHRVPTNDGGISFGQAAIANALLG